LTEDEILIRENMLGLDHKTKPKSLTGYRRLEGNKISPTMMFGNTCFIAGTQVLCDNEFKNIEEINIGDKVLTHNNRFKPVTHVMENLTNRIIEVKINSTPLITCTLEHPFLTIEGWKNAGRLNENDFVAMAKIDKEQTVIWDGVTKHTSNPLIQRVIKTLPVESKNFWTFIGRWLADGFVFNSIRKGRKTGTFGRVYLCDSIDKQNEIECLLKSIGLNFNKKIINNTVKYVMTSKELVKFLKDFGSSCSNKNIPTKYLNLRADLMQSLLVGYLSGDGHQPRNGVWEFVTVSQRLFLGLHSICNKLGYRITCKEKEPGEWNIEGRSGVTLKTWSGRIYLDPIKKDFKDVDGIRFYKVSSVLIKEFETKVFNISVQDDETYTANGVVVHNCLPIHPTEDRSISVREAATIQTFPADFVFCGGIASQYKQVGNAVPPAFSILLAKQLSEL
jgi:intein/homing endonuclease